MGNCQAVDAAALAIQHPTGKVERHYWPISVSEVVKTNPGHYVALIIPLPATKAGSGGSPEKKTVRYTRVKLLRPTDTLVLGHAYRLITAQEVMKVLQAKKVAKTKNSELGSSERLHQNKKEEEGEEERRGKSSTSKNPAVLRRTQSWRPSLQSISEASS